MLGPKFKKLYEDAKAKVDVSEAIIDAVGDGMTMGEMVGIIRMAYGLGYDPFSMIETPDYIVEALGVE